MSAGNQDKNQKIDISLLIQSLSEGRELEKWQGYFCEMTKAFACCMNGRGEPITEFGGNPDEIPRVLKAIDKEQLQGMLQRVADSALEDQAIETTSYPNLRLATISVKIAGKPIISWLICGILSDFEEEEEYSNPPLYGFSSTMREKDFYKAVDMLRYMSDELIRYKSAILSAQAESRKSRYAEKEMESTLRRTEALTEVVQLLESDDTIEGIMIKLLGIVGRFLNISSAAVCRKLKDGEHMSIIAHWCNKGIMWSYDSDVNQEIPFFLKSEKTLVLSEYSVLRDEEREELENRGIKSLIALPVTISGAVSMHACFTEKTSERTWQLEEITFLNDAVKILQSIFDRRIQKNSLASSFASLETILDNVGSAVYVKDLATGEALFANKHMRYSFKKELQDGSVSEILEKEIKSENGVGEIYIDSKDKWYELYYTRMTWVDGNPALLCALYDETEKKVYQTKIEQQAYTDFLTGLYNRMSCERDLAKYVDEAIKNGQKGALIYMDMDDFKHINDGLGHQYGDELLKQISRSFQKIEGIRNTCYRMGGDEFVVIVPPWSYSRLEEIITEIKDLFLKPWFIKDSDYYCTMSMGVAQFPEAGDNIHDLIKKADIAMYEAKRHGKNGITRYSDSIVSESNQRLDMEKNMREATARGYGEFVIYYQPIMDVQKEGSPCTGAEALIRWNSAERGFIPPSDFIPLAEYLGLINPIGRYVLMEACQQCKKWNDGGYPEYKVNVNLSVIQLMQNDIVETIKEAIMDSGLKPQNLTLEVTESLAINDMDRMKEILGRIKNLGVRIALDDFGTGYSSLNHIREIPFDVIKVDQSFIKGLEEDEYAKSFIRMVAELAESIDVNLCVEGVETESQYEILSDMRISLVQGYYFDKPLPVEQFDLKYASKTIENTKVVN